MSSSRNSNFSKDCGCNNSSITNFFDFYGKTMNIKISGKDKQSSTLGAIIGFISLLAMITLSSYFLFSLFNRSSVSVMYNQNRDMTPLNNLSNTPIVFKLIDPSGMPIDSKGLYDIDVIMAIYSKYTKEDGSFAMNYTPVKVAYTKCDLNSTFGEHKNLFTDFPSLNDLFCIAPESNNLTIYGKYSDSVTGFSFINFYVNKCINGTESKCMSDSEIDERLSNVYFAFTFLDYQIDHNNSSQVYRQVVKTSTYSMSYNIHKRYFYYIRQVFYTTDEGFVFRDHKKDAFYQQDEYQFDVRFPGQSLSSSSNLGIFSVTNENKIDFYYRSYLKFQNIIADIGGVVKGILISCQIINYIFMRNFYSLQIANSVFDFDLEDKIPLDFRRKSFTINENKNHTTNSKFINLQNSFNNNNHNIIIGSNNNIKNISPLPYNQNIILNNENKINDANTNNRRISVDKINLNCARKIAKIKIGWCSLILPKIVNPHKDKIDILENCENIINQNLSVQFILEKFYEIQKIKQIVMNKESNLAHLNSVTKPMYKDALDLFLNKNLEVELKKSKFFMIEEK